MERWQRGILAVSTLAPLALCSPARSDVLFRRVEVLEEQVGRIDLRSAYGVRLTIPVDCEDDKTGCSQPTVYDEVLSIDLALETRSQLDAGIADEAEARGSLHVALAFDPDELQAVREVVRKGLLDLSAHAFAQEFAGLTTGRAPLEATLAKQSRQPIWICSESGSFAVGVLRRTGGDRDAQGKYTNVNLYSSHGAKPTTPMCDEMRAATADVHPETLRTLSQPLRFNETTVSFDDLVSIDTRATDTLAARPPEARLFKRRVDSTGRGSSMGSSDELTTSQWMGGGWRFESFTEPVALAVETLDRNAWLQRWVVETVDRRTGAHPEDRLATRSSFVVAYLATDPPSPVEGVVPGRVSAPASTQGMKIPEESGRPFTEDPAAIDRPAFLERVVSGLEDGAGEPRDLLPIMIAAPPAGLRSEGWIAVICRDDGSATYTLPPTAGAQRVTNPDLFCAAVESRLERAK